jgi:hypothetical protein
MRLSVSSAHAQRQNQRNSEDGARTPACEFTADLVLVALIEQAADVLTGGDVVEGVVDSGKQRLASLVTGRTTEGKSIASASEYKCVCVCAYVSG